MPSSISSVFVVGAGWNGRQVAAQCVAHGIRTFLSDTSDETMHRSIDWIHQHTATMVSENVWPANSIDLAKSNLIAVKPAAIAALQVELAIECVHEQISSKRRVLRELSETLPKTAIIASNSSYFMPTTLSKFVEHPERFAHFHFHSPVWTATIVDVVLGPEAKSEIADQLVEFAKKIGQTPILQNVENPGYIFNWILQAMLKASLELVERRVASPEEIELSWKTITAMRVGPFGMMDQIGIDLIHQVMSNARWLGDYDKTQKLIDILQPLLDRGELGVKSGQGFFDYSRAIESTDD
ncbi:MAG: 3-hydroxyacyl-CoA dehydrogenase NAD-binding domain-containing protein [Pirellulaceae bacterium]|nr:3-hydroxyacyl-CoA dehydrogenase NAD-binding domain-containing protein [Pirellulaceae bacterium]